MTPEQRQLSAEFEASLLGGEAYMEQWTFSVDWRIKTAEYDRSALDPTEPAGQLAAMELLKMAVHRAKDNKHDGWWAIAYNPHGNPTDVHNSPGAAITAAWLAAAERWKAKATPSDAAG